MQYVEGNGAGVSVFAPHRLNAITNPNSNDLQPFGTRANLPLELSLPEAFILKSNRSQEHSLPRTPCYMKLMYDICLDCIPCYARILIREHTSIHDRPLSRAAVRFPAGAFQIRLARQCADPRRPKFGWWRRQTFPAAAAAEFGVSS